MRADDDYPLADTEATQMLGRALERALSEEGLTQRDIARRLNYKSSVVLSHMASGRVPIPIDRALEIAALLKLDPARFTLAVLRQRHPNIDFSSLFGAPPPAESLVAQELEAVAGRPLDELPPAVVQILREVIDSGDPGRRWVSLEELPLLGAVRTALGSRSRDTLSKQEVARLQAFLAGLDES